MVCLTLVFSNKDQRLTLEVEDTLSVYQFKQDLLGRHWPDFQIDASKVEKLRLFCMGKELVDARAMSKYSEFPLLVHVLKEGVLAPVPEQQEDCCSCRII